MKKARSAALATLEAIEAEGLIERARRLGLRGRGPMEKLKQKFGCIADVRGLGCYFGMEVSDFQGYSAPELADRLLYDCLGRGPSFKLGGGNVIALCPPLTIAEEGFDCAFAILDEAFAAAAG